MQLTLLSTAAFVASVSALQRATTAELNAQCNTNQAYAEIINRCSYDVNLWSVFRSDGCPTTGGNMVTLKTGQVYRENLFNSTETATGISVKISKTQQCKGSDIVQLEYYLENNKPGFNYNYLDVSYVDCLGNTCPTRQEGYYLVSGNQVGTMAASAANTWCPILSCHDQASCDKCSYVLPDDVQTKTCAQNQNIKFYMCGGEAPTQDYDTQPAKGPVSPPAAPKPAPSSVDDTYKIKAAAVTSSPAAPEPPKVKTEIVYVTAYEYVNEKRGVHGHHARRHGQRHA